MKKITKIFLVLCILFAQILIQNTEVEAMFEGYTPISTKIELANMSLSGKYYLTNDIIFEEEDFQEGGMFYNRGYGWEGVFATENTPFTGILDGNGYCIDGIYINTINVKHAGFIGVCEGTIRNLGLTNVKINKMFDDAASFVGGLVGYLKGGVIESCFVTGTIDQSKRANAVGALVGIIDEDGRVSNCYSNTIINSIATTIGGLVGICGSGTVEKSYNLGNITGKKYTSAIGGVVGGSGGDETCVIDQCYNIGNITASDPELYGVDVGGITASVWGTLSNCYNAGRIDVSTYYSDTKVAGIAVDANTCTISNCYTVGTMKTTSGTISSTVARIRSKKCSLENIYYLDTLVEDDYLNDIYKVSKTRVESKTNEELLNKESYIGFDFENIWTIDSNGAYQYPTLRNASLAIKSIEITKLPTKLTYQLNENLDLSGGLVKVTYTNNTSQVIKLEQAVVQGFDSTSAGKKTISVSCNNASTSFDISVIQPITSVIVDKKLALYVDEVKQLNVTILPEDATEDKSVSWTSEDEQIATVDKDGFVTGVKAGTTIITATTLNNLSATCEVTVNPNVITLNKDIFVLNVDETNSIQVFKNGIDIEENQVTFKSQNPSIVSVDTNGKITGLQDGETVIEVKTKDETKYVTAIVCANTVDLHVGEIVKKEYYTTNNLGYYVDIQNHDSAFAIFLGIGTVVSNGQIYYSRTFNFYGVNESVSYGTLKTNNGEILENGHIKINVKVNKLTVEPYLNENLIFDIITFSDEVLSTDVDDSLVDFDVLSTSKTTKTTTVNGESSSYTEYTYKVSLTFKEKGNYEFRILDSNLNSIYEIEANVYKVAPNQIELDKDTLILNVGETYQFEATVSPNESFNKEVNWISSNPNIASVDEKGLLAVKSSGTVTITASTFNNIKATCVVTVLNPIKAISLNKDNVSVNKGDTLQLVATINPSDTTDDTQLSWVSSNPEIVSVNSLGLITAHNAGVATVRVTTINGIEAICNVTVYNPITSITLDKSTAKINIQDKLQLNATLNPSDTTDDTTLTWSSNDTSVAIVDSTGLVTAVGVGSAKITVKCVNGKNVSCNVTVVAPITSIEVNKTSATINVTETLQLQTTIIPYYTTDDKTLTWSSSKNEVATVNSEGLVTAISPGNTTITVSSVNGIYTTCYINVLSPITSICINETNKTMNKGETLQLVASILPDNTTSNKTVVWKSNNPDIASIDENGLVTALKAGEATITATTVNNISAKCEIKVAVPLKGIFFARDYTFVQAGHQFEFEVDMEPKDTTDDRSLIWTSSNEQVISFDKNGNALANNPGVTVIRVETKNGLYDEIAVEVIDPNLIVKTENIILETGDCHVVKLGVDSRFNYTASFKVHDSQSIIQTDKDGTITALNPGGANYEVSGFLYYDNFVFEYKTTGFVEVVDKINVIKFKQNQVQFVSDYWKELELIVDPISALVSNELTWKSSNEDVAVVYNTGYIHTLSEGKSIITVTTKTGKSASCEIVVKNDFITSIVLNKSELELYVDQSKELAVTILPEDTSQSKEIIWESSNPNIVSVNNGKVTALKVGKATITAISSNGKTATCQVTVTSDVYRIYGEDRYQTSYKTANELKNVLGVDKFDTVIVASGANFADALAGSYLSSKSNAPIIMTGKSDRLMKDTQDYIRDNLNIGGTVYILGGTAAIPASFEGGLSRFKVKRLAGADRYETNLAILEEAGVTNEEILVCTGTNFADSLSASATGLPILLVQGKLNLSQKQFLSKFGGKAEITIVGGVNAVKVTLENQLKQYGTTTRLAGETRYYTSTLVASRYFSNPDKVVLAYAQNFPDGLSGGPLANTINVPLILTDSVYKNYKVAQSYTENHNIHNGYVLGGSKLISDEKVIEILELNSKDDILIR